MLSLDPCHEKQRSVLSALEPSPLRCVRKFLICPLKYGANKQSTVEARRLSGRPTDETHRPTSAAASNGRASCEPGGSLTVREQLPLQYGRVQLESIEKRTRPADPS